MTGDGNIHVKKGERKYEVKNEKVCLMNKKAFDEQNKTAGSLPILIDINRRKVTYPRRLTGSSSVFDRKCS